MNLTTTGIVKLVMDATVIVERAGVTEPDAQFRTVLALVRTVENLVDATGHVEEFEIELVRRPRGE
ncbi:hypothetical protein [Frigoriglobus tundricola]|nr:hypothetical protein [Frigoriglobus tundricola]